jgi:hypothetical protein
VVENDGPWVPESFKQGIADAEGGCVLLTFSGNALMTSQQQTAAAVGVWATPAGRAN